MGKKYSNKNYPSEDESGYDENDLCKLCQKGRTTLGHDPCIANLPGVLFACCGHGYSNGYIKFTDGRCLRFKPLQVDLDKPTKRVVVTKNIPVFQKGDSWKVFKFKTGKVKLKEHKGVVGKTISVENVPVRTKKTKE